MRVGDRSRCLRCGGKIVLTKHPRIISLTAGPWVHSGAIRRGFSSHFAEGPS